MYSVEKTKGLNTFKRFDYALFIAVLILSIIGIFVLSSATLTLKNGNRLMTIQIATLVLGVIISLAISALDYKDFKVLGIVFYIFSIALLALVLVIGIGETEWGSKSWLRFAGVGIQPSELAKITFVIVTSVFLERIKEGNMNRSNVLKLIFYALVPIMLVLAQPDFGTAMVFIFIFFIMIFLCGLPYRYIVGTFLASIPIMAYLWFFRLKDYQKYRILVVFFPGLDPKGYGFNVNQAMMAIGSGQMLGKGLYQGIQTQNSSVPVKESDFIFSVVGEELGLIGAVIIIALVFFILLRCVYIAKNSRDLYGSFLVTGLASMMAFHFVENIGMCIGLLPVTGIPLPFISSGGSSMITNYIAIGVILSVSMRRQRVIFNNSQ